MSGRPTRFQVSDNSKRSIGIIGAGNISSRIHLPIIEHLEGTAPTFVADIDQGKARNLANKYNCEAIFLDNNPSILPECDIALIAIPVGVREPYLSELGERRTPVFVEKPFTVDIETHKEYLQTLKQATCNYMRTWYGSTQILRKIVETKMFGMIEGIHIQNGLLGSVGVGPDHYRNNPELAGGGVLMESGCHTLSQIDYVLSEYEINVKEADLEWYGNLDVALDTTFIAGKERDFEITYSLTRLKPMVTQTRFEFENATVEVDHTSASGSPVIKTDDGKDISFEHDSWATSFEQAVYLRWQEFLSALDNNNQPDIDQLTSIRTTELISDIYKAAKKKRN